jgi:uncharacterized protein YcgI (DUF1989 family)
MYALASIRLQKHALNVRHIGPNINFFMNVPVTSDGHLNLMMVFLHQEIC